MTDKELKQLCDLWQQRMRLRDWQVDVGFVHHFEMSEPMRIGECLSNPDHKQAIIKILHPFEIPAYVNQREDSEKILVHELCHLHTGVLKNAKDEVLEENAVAAFTDALIGGYRNGNIVNKRKR